MRIAKIACTIILVFVLLVGLSGQMNAAIVSPDLVPFREGDTWGYADPAGELQIPATYDAAMPFRAGSAVIYRNGRAGLIDAEGQVLLPAVYDAILNDAMLRLRKDERYALANRQGKLLTDFAYDLIHPEKSGLFLVEADGFFGMIDTAGLEVVPPRYAHLRILRDAQGNYTDLIQVHQDGKLGLYDRCGNAISEPVYEQINVFRDAFAVVKRANRFGLLDLEGHEVVPAVYENLHPPRRGMAAANVKGRWGFVDTEGREVIPFRYDGVNEAGFFQGRAAVQYRGKWSFIDRQGKPEIAVDGPYQCLGAMSEGMASVCLLSEAGHPFYGYLNNKGRLVIPCQFTRAYPFIDGFAVVGKYIESGNSMAKKLRYGVIDRKGDRILPLGMASYAEAEGKREVMARFGWARIMQDGKICNVNEKGRIYGCEYPASRNIMLQYAQTQCENQALIGVANEGRWGFCDLKGKVVVPMKYAIVHCFEDGLAMVWPDADSEFHYYIDAAGKEYFRAPVRN